MVDLDELDRLHASRDQAPEARMWTHGGTTHTAVVTDTIHQAKVLIQLQDAYPALAAEVRALRDVVARAQDLVDELPEHAYECPHGAPGDHVPARCRCHADGRYALRAALAKVPR